MPYNPKIHKRRSIRLKGYDYSKAGLYFITICVQNRECLFGKIENEEMVLNDAGKMIETEWMNLKIRFPNIELNEFVVMPNHFHGILEIVGATLVVAPIDDIMEKGQPQGIAPMNKTIGNMMDAFKSITTVEYIRGVKNLGWKPFNGKLWQRNYYEHIIRNQQSYENISNYIQNNPAKWQENK
jgi:REP element-mobilizing transposase RayT